MKLPFRLLGVACVCSMAFMACQQNQKTAATQATKPAESTNAVTESTPTNSKPAASTAKSDEDQVIDLIMDLQEIKLKNAEVERLSHGKRRLSTYVESGPSTDDPNYTVKVAEDNGSNLVTYYTFAVDGKTRHIKYYDVVQDTLISLEEWRKTTPLKDR